MMTKMLFALHLMAAKSAFYTNPYMYCAPGGVDINEVNRAKKKNRRNKSQKRKAKR